MPRKDPEELKVVGEPFTTERYGVGLAKGDAALQTFINTMFTDGGDTWTAIFEEPGGERPEGHSARSRQVIRGGRRD